MKEVSIPFTLECGGYVKNYNVIKLTGINKHLCPTITVWDYLGIKTIEEERCKGEQK